jgi:PAS domain S-box-containing protein
LRVVGVSLDQTERKKADAAHALLAAIVESSDDAIVGKDVQGNIISWNNGAQRMYGYTPQEILGRPVTLLTSPDRPDEEAGILSRIRSGNVVQHYETVRIRKNGQPIHISLSVSPIRDSKGQVVGVSSISRDISERKHAEDVLAQQAAALQEQAQLLDLANVLARNLEHRIILWSAGMEQMFGWTKAEALGRVSHELLATQFPEPLEALTAHFLREGEWSGELVHRRRNGEPLTVASRWVLHHNDQGQPMAILEINNDITARKHAEEEIRRLNAELEQRVQERTAALSQANDELEAFTYSVSHDLRAPLRHIDAFARIIQEDLTDQSPPDLRNYVDRIRKGTQTMGRLVDDLLKLSRVGRAEPDWQRINLNVLVEEVLADLKAETASRQIEWRLNSLPTAACDPGLIKQVFANLLSNAIKYTRPRHHAVIEVGQMRLPDETVIFVRDNGVGFDMKYVGKLFGVFERLHRLEDFEGTGIGLATVRRIIQKHGGRVWAEADPDKGAVFYFTLQGLAESVEK